MTIKASQLWLSQGTLGKLVKQTIEEDRNVLAGTSYLVKRLLDRLQPELNLIEAARVDLVKKYGEDTPSGDKQVTEANLPEFNSEFATVLQQDIEVDVKPVPISRLEVFTLSVLDLTTLDWLITE